MLINVQYPEVVLNNKDCKAAIDAGEKLSILIDRALIELDNNIAITTSEESGIARREKILGINPLDTATLEERRFEVLLKWYSTPTYTEVTLRAKLDSILGQNNYVLNIDLDKKTVQCQIELTKKALIQSIEDLFEQMIPLDYLLDVTLRYHQYKDLEPYTYAQLEKMSWEQLRNEVITIAKN